jgi:hypothetical protein
MQKEGSTVKVTLRLAAYGQAPSELRSGIFIQLNPCGLSPYVTSFLTRRWGSLMNMLGL